VPHRFVCLTDLSQPNNQLTQPPNHPTNPPNQPLYPSPQVLHDAFFRHQTKPKLTQLGELYYEGKEYEAAVGNVSFSECFWGGLAGWAGRLCRGGWRA
jgi:hypothetical protein